MSDAKTDYRELCRTEPTIPLFCRDWWLDAVCGPEAWDVVLTGKARIEGALPFFLKKRGPFSISTMPKLTQHLGPWIRPTKAKYARNLTHSIDTMEELIVKLPKVDYFIQAFPRDNLTWLPFRWNGYAQTTAYTYTIDARRDPKLIWDDFKTNIRGGVRKAEQEVTVRTGGIEEFIELNRKIFVRQGLALPYPEELLHRLDAACAQQGRREILVAEDKLGNAHAATFCVFDDTTTYYLLAGSDPAFRSSQALTLLLWEAIKNAGKRGQIFDFEGSMIRPIEQFVRNFSAVATPYSVVTKASRLVAFGLAAKAFIGR